MGLFADFLDGTRDLDELGPKSLAKGCYKAELSFRCYKVPGERKHTIFQSSALTLRWSCHLLQASLQCVAAKR